MPITALAFSVVDTVVCGVPGPAVVPATGPVSRLIKAIAIANAAATKFYGTKTLAAERPLKGTKIGSQ